jgi:hypothetical protein
MVDTIDSVTAAQWAWRADDGWVEYDDGPNLLIENEFLNGTKRIKVDTERFVDVSMTVCLLFSIFPLASFFVFSRSKPNHD